MRTVGVVGSAKKVEAAKRMGATFVMRMQEDTGESPAQIAKAYAIARDLLDARQIWAAIEALDGKVHGDAQIDAMLQVWHLIRNLTRWLLNLPGGRLDIAGAVSRYGAAFKELRDGIGTVFAETDRQIARQARA